MKNKIYDSVMWELIETHPEEAHGAELVGGCDISVRIADDAPRKTIHFVPAMLEKNWWLADEEWLIERTRFAVVMLRECTEVNPRKRGGVPVLKGTRFTVAQFFGELAEGRSVGELAEDFDLDLELVKRLLEGLAICLDRPAFK